METALKEKFLALQQHTQSDHEMWKARTKEYL